MAANEQVAERIQALRDEIRAVRASIVEMLARIDHITLQELPQIRIDYAVKIGCWEQELLEAELAGRRARRRLALAQAEANRGQAIELAHIDSQLDIELADWQAKAEAARLAYEAALKQRLGTQRLSHTDAKEVRHLYRTLVKRLHPDVCHGGAREAALFKMAQAAYANGDVEALRSLEVATRHMDPSEDDLELATSESELEQELELARIEEDVVRERLEQTEDCEEMRLGRLLNSTEWLTQRTSQLRDAIDGWRRVKHDCERRLAELMEV